MGIVNVTPDSFSDGGRYLNAGAAIAHGLRLFEQGADIIDVGGESTRPQAVPVPEEEELRRVLPVIKALARQVPIAISVDTLKPAVACAALEAGASVVNDVGANRADLEMARLVAEAGAGYVCVHMQGTPQTMQTKPHYDDVVGEVQSFFIERIRRLNDCGVGSDQIILDIGMGFGKSLDHNLRLLGALGRFRGQGRPLMLGASRKSFVGKLLGSPSADRLPASLACACLAVEAGAAIIRAHDVVETVQAVRMTEAVLASKT